MGTPPFLMIPIIGGGIPYSINRLATSDTALLPLPI